MLGSKQIYIALSKAFTIQLICNIPSQLRWYKFWGSMRWSWLQRSWVSQVWPAKARRVCLISARSFCLPHLITSHHFSDGKCKPLERFTESRWRWCVKDVCRQGCLTINLIYLFQVLSLLLLPVWKGCVHLWLQECSTLSTLPACTSWGDSHFSSGL